MIGTGMVNAGVIAIDICMLHASKAKLDDLAREVANHKLTLSLDSSKGDSKQELLSIGEYLQSFGQEFELLVSRCSDVLNNTAVISEEMDTQKIAVLFSSGNG